MSTMMKLTSHYVGIAERIGLDEVYVDLDEGFVLVQAAGHPMAIDLYPSDPSYLRVLASSPLPIPADPWQVAHEVTAQMKMVKAHAFDEQIQLAVETLADPSAGLQLPTPDVAAEALARVVDTLLAAIDHISDAGQLAGILAATDATDAADPDPDPDIYVPCLERGQHTALVECWMCWSDVHAGRIPLHAALRNPHPTGSGGTAPARGVEGGRP